MPTDLVHSSSKIKSYAVTLLVTISTMFTVIFVNWSLSHSLESSEYDLYLILIRYIGLLATLCGFSHGFLIISGIQPGFSSKDIFNYVFIPVLLSAFILSLIVFGLYPIGAKLSLVVIGWVCVLSLFHIYISYVRSYSPLNANIDTLILKSGAFILSSSIVVYFDFGLTFFFAALFLIFALWFALGFKRYELNGAIGWGGFGVYKKLYTHSYPRALDNVMRALHHVVLVFFVGELNSLRAAALVSVGLLITKTIESLMQPLVMHVFRSSQKKLINISKLPVLYVFIASCVAVVVLRYVLGLYGDTLIRLWLTDVYSDALDLILIMLYAFPAVVTLQCMKGLYESGIGKSIFLIPSICALIVSVVIYMVFKEPVLCVYGYVLSFYIRLVFVYVQLRSR